VYFWKSAKSQNLAGIVVDYFEFAASRPPSLGRIHDNPRANGTVAK
jgi:hypothetical protein